MLAAAVPDQVLLEHVFVSRAQQALKTIFAITM
jgi:hypothetical protein